MTHDDDNSRSQLEKKNQNTLVVMASTLVAMPATLAAMASASNLVAMASTLVAMASNLVGLLPTRMFCHGSQIFSVDSSEQVIAAAQEAGQTCNGTAGRGGRWLVIGSSKEQL